MLICGRLRSRDRQAPYLNRAAGPAMKLASPLAGRSPRLRLGLRLVLALEIERHCGADEILQSRLIDLVAFMDVDGAPGVALEAGVEEA
jgi:hypothetical protein